MNDTPTKSKCDRTPTKATCDRTPTPRTDAKQKLKDIIGDEYVAVDFARQLERELTAALAEIDRLDVSGIHSCHANCQKSMCVMRRELTAVTKQRDEMTKYANKLAHGFPDGMLPKDVEVLREANLGLAVELTAVTEQRDEARKLAEKYRYLSCESQEEADAEVLPWENN